jgi:LPS export ABC transporter protein LptC
LQAFKLNTIYFIFWGCFLFAACENDFRDIQKASSYSVDIPVDTFKGVEIIFSDSAVVKGKLITPLMLNFSTENPYHEMPKGLTAIFYDENQRESSRIIADHGTRRVNEKLIELRRNVVVTTQQGDTFKSDELFWDETRKIFYSNQLVTITKPDGTSISGTQFQSDQNFENPVIQNASGSLATGNTLTN